MTQIMVDLDRLLAPRNLRIWDWPHEAVQVLFIPGRARKDWEGFLTSGDGLLYTAVKGYREDRYKYIVIPGNDGSYVKGQRMENGYPGGQVWKKLLVTAGIPADDVVLVGETGVDSNTLTETIDFVTEAQERKWTTGMVLNNPHQTTRVMLGLINVFKKTGQAMKVYPNTPQRNNWNQPVYGSGGLREMPRAKQILEELRRIPIYQKNGDLASWEELESYYKDVLKVEW